MTQVDGTDVEPTWGIDWSRMVGEQIKIWRGRRGLSAQQLADRTRTLGYTVSRNTIASLESGRKETVPIQELVTIARTLEVAPLALLFPVGTIDTVGVPGPDRISTWEAALWFSGEVRKLTSADDPMHQDWGRGEYSLGYEEWDAGETHGIWEYYIEPRNDAGALSDLRLAEAELTKWRALMPLVKHAFLVFTTAKTDSVIDTWQSVFQYVGQQADKHWQVMEAHRAKARTYPVPADLHNMESEEADHAKLLRLLAGESS
ncbi:helix-turn-helix transcriptional regulator [Nakamurella antarctica]|nr:helix-turn-helix transcriptional regulator [Nakamurella antarctica]